VLADESESAELWQAAGDEGQYSEMSSELRHSSGRGWRGTGQMAAAPTRFPDLNRVLADLVTGARAILGDNFCGAYLQGSFAVGDADEHSDVDFVIVAHEDVGEAQQSGLQALQ